MRLGGGPVQYDHYSSPDDLTTHDRHHEKHRLNYDFEDFANVGIDGGLFDQEIGIQSSGFASSSSFSSAFFYVGIIVFFLFL